jgi:hypothetical protein
MPMIEITEGFTSISAGADHVSTLPAAHGRAHTGARVTMEFCRDAALAPGQKVNVNYDFAGDGTTRTTTGIPTPIRTDARYGCAVVYHYRLSHWLAPEAL